MMENMSAPAETQADEATHSAVVAQPSAADPAVAFDRMRRQLAVLSAAVEGFAARQQELHGRDYTDDLAKIFDQHQRMVKAITILDGRPAMDLTPEDIASQIEAAGTSVRAADHRAIGDAAARLDNAATRINGVVDSAVTARQQNTRIVRILGAAVPLCLLFMTVAPGTIARFAPASWYWPERMAARVLRLDGWSAGVHLLRVVNSDRVERLLNEARVGREYQAALDRCARQTVKSKRSAPCAISIRL